MVRPPPRAGEEGEGDLDDPALIEDDPAAVLLNMASMTHTQQPSETPTGLAGVPGLALGAAPTAAAGWDGAAAPQTVEAQTRSGLVYAQARPSGTRACTHTHHTRAHAHAHPRTHTHMRARAATSAWFGMARLLRLAVRRSGGVAACSGTKQRQWVRLGPTRRST